MTAISDRFVAQMLPSFLIVAFAAGVGAIVIWGLSYLQGDWS